MHDDGILSSRKKPVKNQFHIFRHGFTETCKLSIYISTRFFDEIKILPDNNGTTFVIVEVFMEGQGIDFFGVKFDYSPVLLLLNYIQISYETGICLILSADDRELPAL